MKQHYFLIAGKVMFKSEEGIGTLNINGVIEGKERNLGIKQIALMQQMLQANAFRQLGGPVEVVGVTILSFNHLGHMSEREWNNMDVGSIVQSAAELSGIDSVQ